MRERAERLIDGMVAAGLTADATDPGMKGLTRYGRLPVGVNGKAKYVQQLGRPFEQRVAAWSPSTRYSVGQIAAAYGVKLNAWGSDHATRRRRKPVTRSETNNPEGCLEWLAEADLYLEPVSGATGAHRIICPWVYEHTDEDPSGTVYFTPCEENNGRGGFKCHHGHCQSRNIADLIHFLNRLQQISA